VDMIITPTKIIRTTGKLTEKQKKEEVRKWLK
jgi:hypothetical protein